MVLNGIPVRSGRLLDATSSFPDYEEACLGSLRRHVRAGDDVTVVGGGLGVSATACANRGADVTVYEAAAEKCDRIRDTAQLNKVDHRIEVERGIVGKAVDVFGSPVERVVDPTDLEPADVLELDCEGAELDILSELPFTPRVVVVEVHPNLGVEEREVRSVLSEMGYDVEMVGTHDSDTGIVILEGVRS